MVQLDQLKVAIAHYWFIRERGGEKVIKNLLEIFPQADIYTLFYEPKTMGEMLKGHKVITSNLDHAWLRPRYTKCFPLYPRAVKSLKLEQDYDLLISSESGPIKGITKPEHTKHICYTHTPMRYCWGHTEEYTRDLPKALKPIAHKAFKKLQRYDVTTIDNVDHYIANSKNVSDRIKTYYHRDSTIIHPPVEDRAFETPLVDPRPQNKTYLSFGALVPYKRIDLLVETFNKRDDKLIIVGEGSERKRLEHLAGSNIDFKGSLPWEDIVSLMQTSKALIFPGEEDFGIIPLEAMALGCPVIAYAKGGALETVTWSGEAHQSTGLFFEEQTTNALEECLNQFEKIENEFNPRFLREHAQKFSQNIFQTEIKNEVQRILSQT